MKLALVFPELPPALDGIGDYTARLAKALAGRCDVTVHTAAAQFDAIEGVQIERSFTIEPASGVSGLHSALLAQKPDWILLQYNPFSYGFRGKNLDLPRVIHRIKKDLPATKFAMMVHEPFVPVDTLGNLVMTTWQRWQLWRLGQAADLIYFSIEPWVERFSAWFKRKPVHHLPVGSNMPLVDSDRARTRNGLGVGVQDFVIGIFGTLHPSRLMHFIDGALQSMQQVSLDPVVLYIGPHGEKAKSAIRNVRVIDAGKLSAEEVSHHFQAMDLYLAPFRKGVSARRGSFLVGIQHGIATVSTHGIHTDSFLRKADGAAFLLVPDNDSEAFADRVNRIALGAELREKVAAEGQKFFNEHFSWSKIAERQYSDMISFGIQRNQGDPSTVLQ